MGTATGQGAGSQELPCPDHLLCTKRYPLSAKPLSLGFLQPNLILTHITSLAFIFFSVEWVSKGHLFPRTKKRDLLPSPTHRTPQSGRGPWPRPPGWSEQSRPVLGHALQELTARWHRPPWGPTQSPSWEGAADQGNEGVGRVGAVPPRPQGFPKARAPAPSGQVLGRGGGGFAEGK